MKVDEWVRAQQKREARLRAKAERPMTKAELRQWFAMRESRAS